MSTERSYWIRATLSRHAALRGAALAGGGLAALSLVGCGGSSAKKEAMERRIRLFGEKVLPRVHQIGATSTGAKSAEFVAAGD